jgi:hypothetical protein
MIIRSTWTVFRNFRRFSRSALSLRYGKNLTFDQRIYRRLQICMRFRGTFMNPV